MTEAEAGDRGITWRLSNRWVVEEAKTMCMHVERKKPSGLGEDVADPLFPIIRQLMCFEQLQGD